MQTLKTLARYALIGYIVDKGFNVLVAAVAIIVMLLTFNGVFKLW